jgi:hypothetical protein
VSGSPGAHVFALFAAVQARCRHEQPEIRAWLRLGSGQVQVGSTSLMAGQAGSRETRLAIAIWTYTWI